MFGLFARDDAKRRFEYCCSCCGKIHRGAPSFAHKKPPAYFDVPVEERDARVTLDSDLCVIEPAEGTEGEPLRFIRATIDIPIHDADEPFCWGVWVSVSARSFKEYVATYHRDQSDMGCFGWLPANLAGYELRDEDGFLEAYPCDVLWGSASERPTIELHEGDHRLFADQRDGITWERAAYLAELAMGRH